ncbi:hypothetical protein ACFSX9_16020 [Flavobacterium ardleyense]|uniref:Uncharacterized protein n=1 Tax=Flavobacterium ardleyense TaxID=2038737 RepID=A0ABW5ZE55_9FLAO
MRILKNLKEYNKTVLLNSFPNELQNDVEIVIEFLNDEKLEIHPNLENPFFVNSKIIIIPYRIYSNESTKNIETNLTEKQITILNCLYLTHNNGYLRQQKLEQLRENFEDFVIPYKMKVLSEYVIEIISEVESQINEKTIGSFLKFIDENPQYWNLVKSRIISYWGEYYKHSCKLKDYIGYKIIKKIELELKR